jgi:hypothetical protein
MNEENILLGKSERDEGKNESTRLEGRHNTKKMEESRVHLSLASLYSAAWSEYE